MRILIRISVIIFGALFLLCLIAAWFLTTSPGENLVKGWLESRISAEIGMPVSIGSFETNLLTRVQFDTLVVMQPMRSHEEPVLFVGHLRIQYSIPNLLGDQLRLGLIEVDSLTLALAFDSLGRSGLPLLDDPTPDVSGTEKTASLIVIDSVSLSKVGASYRDKQLPLLAEASGVQVSTSGSADGSHTGVISVSDIAIAYDSLNFRIRDFDIAATLIDETLQMKYLRADFHGLAVDASGAIVLSDSPELDLTAGIEGSIAGIASAVDSVYGNLVTAGVMTVDLGIQGTFDNPKVNLNGSFRNLVSSNLMVDSILVLAQYVDNEIDLTALQLGLLGGTIAAKGSAIVDSAGDTQFEIALNGLAFSEIWRSVYSEYSPYQGELSGTINIAGRGIDWESWAIDAILGGENIRYNNKAIPDLSCQAILRPGKANLLLAHGSDTIRSDLRIFNESIEGKFDVKIPDLTALARFIDIPDLSGEFQSNGTVRGSFTNPTISADVFGSNISYQNFPVDFLNGQFSYADSLLTIVEFECKGYFDSINAAAPPFGLDSISGGMAYQVRLSGPLDNLQGQLTTNMNSPGYAQYSLDSLSMIVFIRGSKIEVSQMIASLGDLNAHMIAVFDTTTKIGSCEITLRSLIDSIDEEIETATELTSARDILGTIGADFSLEPDSQFKANITGDKLWLGLIPELNNDTMQVDGDASFKISLDGSYLAPNAELYAKIESMEIADQRVDSIVTSLSLNPQALTLNSLSLHALEQTLRASGWLGMTVNEDGYYAIQQDGVLKADLSTMDFSLAVFKDFLLPEGDIAGKVSATLQVSGSMSSPTFNGWLKLDRGWVLVANDSPPLDSIAMSLSFVDTVLTIDSAAGIVSAIPIRANGSLITSQFESVTADLIMRVGQFGGVGISGSISDENIQLEIGIDTVNLSALEPFVPLIDSLAGSLSANIGVQGELASPEFDGYVNLRAAAFHAPRYNVRIADGCADMRFDHNRVSIDSASAILNGGSVFLTGVVSHDQGELIDIGLEARASKVRLEEPEAYLVLVDSATLVYGRQNENYILDGDIILGESRLVTGLRPSAILPWVQSIETVDFDLPELIARTRLNVRIRESDKFWVDNNLARIRLRADVGVIGTPLRPNFTGLVRVEEGYLLYLDRRFKVNEGSVYFTDPNRFNPDIKLDASTQITVYKRTTAEPYRIYIQAEGYLDQLRYGLFSEPALDRPDIVALLTLGATRSELTKSGDNSNGSGLTQVLKDRAAMLTSQKVSGYVSRKVGSVFGFDEFSIQGNLFQFDDSWGPQLVASKRLSQRVDLTYSTTVGHLNDQSVRLGYRLTPRWSLMGETDRQGRSGLDLKYGIRFK